ncbi:MAG TPA: LysE family translocator, partial [Erwinia persicina]|nr:LysE family translocator [Erwinia persicina]
MVLNLPCILIWAMMGDRLGKHLQVAWKLQLFNTLMALSLLATTLWMLVEAFQVA